MVPTPPVTASVFRARNDRNGGRRRLLLLLIVAGILAALFGGGAAAQRARTDRHVVLISLDGFAAFYLDDPKLPIPNIRRLAADGSRADALTASTPSVTWPNHTTLVTGVPPAKHGVLANGRIEPSADGKSLVINPRRSREELCRVPAVYDHAHAAGLKTAEINWPVTRDAASLDWRFPDHPEPLRYTTPVLLSDLQELKLLSGPQDAAFSASGSVMRDHVWTGAAAHLIRRHKPNLLLLHLLLTDGTQHAHGPLTTEAYAALSLADRNVGDVLRALRDAGIAERTSVFVVSDHGFIRTTRQIHPNVRLRQAGLIRDEGGSLVHDAQSISEGGVALVYVPGRRTRPELVARAREAVTGMEGVEAVVSPDGFAELGLPLPDANPPGPDLVLAARDGFAFGNASAGEPVTDLPRPSGTHGYPHTNPKMDGLFVASGAGIRRGARLPRVRNLDVAPTIARLLGLRMPNVDGRVVEEILGR
jgi:predicted AlkP superfamily pyrophosphatase or phosphodiesterase